MAAISSGADVTIAGYRFSMAGAMECDRATFYERTLPKAMTATITGAGVAATNDWDYPITVTGLNYQNAVNPDTTAAITGLANALVKFFFTHPTLGELCVCGTLISPTEGGGNVTGTLRVINYATVPSIFGAGTGSTGNNVTYTVTQAGISTATAGTLGTHVLLNGSDTVTGKIMALGLRAELTCSFTLVNDDTSSATKLHSDSQQALATESTRFNLAQAVNLNNRLTGMAATLEDGFNDPETETYVVAVCSGSNARNNRVTVVLGLSD